MDGVAPARCHLAEWLRARVRIEVAVAAAVALGIAFLVLRRSLRAYVAAAGLIVAVTGLLAQRNAGDPLESPLYVVVASLLFALGLVAVRVIIARSISLTLLDEIEQHIDASGYRARVADRMSDALRLGLVEARGDELVLSAWGRLAARAARLLYAIFREADR
jgi:hypothetical protein